jgi:hypothetical protein
MKWYALQKKLPKTQLQARDSISHQEEERENDENYIFQEMKRARERKEVALRAVEG